MFSNQVNVNKEASSPLSNTCEQLAEDARIEHLASSMVTDENGNRVWKGYDDYKTTNKPGLGMRARYEVMLYLQGFESDFLDKTPEALARKEIEELESTEVKAIESGSETTDNEDTKKGKKKADFILLTSYSAVAFTPFFFICRFSCQVCNNT